MNLAEVTCTAEDLAALAGISARHIRRLPIPKIGRNRYALAEAVPALIEALSGGDAGAELTKERIRLTKAQADRAELEFAKAAREVAPLAEISRAWDRQCALIRARMMQVPARAVLSIIGETDEAKLKAALLAEIKDALSDASKQEISDEDLNEEFPDDDQ